jgi:hypothetical protein
MRKDKYLFLEFENAGFFRDMSRSKDFVFDLNGQKKRIDTLQYVEPITVNQISNALHVLMGERPAPSLRTTNMKRIDYIFEIADNGYLKIDSVKEVNEKKNFSRFPEQTLTMRKCVYNSFSTAPAVINWERVRRLLENELNDKFHALLNQLFNVDVKSTYPTCEDAISLLRKKYRNNDDLIKFIDILKSEGKQPMIDFINGSQKVSDSALQKNADAVGVSPTFNSNVRTLITTNFGVDKITRLRGKIVVALSNEDLEKIRNNKGVAKLLDGGLLWIDKIVDEEEMTTSMLNEYVKINSISTQTKKTKS